jgi:hypothetical protein
MAHFSDDDDIERRVQRAGGRLRDDDASSRDADDDWIELGLEQTRERMSGFAPISEHVARIPYE